MDTKSVVEGVGVGVGLGALVGSHANRVSGVGEIDTNLKLEDDAIRTRATRRGRVDIMLWEKCACETSNIHSETKWRELKI